MVLSRGMGDGVGEACREKTAAARAAGPRLGRVPGRGCSMRSRVWDGAPARAPPAAPEAEAPRRVVVDAERADDGPTIS